MDPRKQFDLNMERDNQHNNGKTFWRFRMQVAVTLSNSDLEQGDVSDKGYALLLKTNTLIPPPPKGSLNQSKKIRYQPRLDSVFNTNSGGRSMKGVRNFISVLSPVIKGVSRSPVIWHSSETTFATCQPALSCW